MKKIVYCPHCGTNVGEVNTITTMAIPLKCFLCNILVVYEGDTGRIKTREIPDRKESSGKRFY